MNRSQKSQEEFRQLWLNMTVPQLERITLWVLPVGLVLMGLVLFRAQMAGFETQRNITILGLVLFLGTLLLRSRIPTKIRLQIYCTYLLLIGLAGLTTLGLLGLGIISLVLAQTVAAMGGIRQWLFFLVLSTIGVVGVGIGFMTGVLTLPVDAQEFMSSPLSWGAALMVFQITTFSALIWEHVLRSHTRWNRALEKMLDATVTVGEESPVDRLLPEIGHLLNVDEVAVLLFPSPKDGQHERDWSLFSLWTRQGPSGIPGNLGQENAPWDQVWQEGIYCRSSGLGRDYPGLADENGKTYEGFIGVRMVDSAGQPMGVLSVLNRTEIQNAGIPSMLRMIAGRIAGEMERQSTLAELRASEHRYRTLFEASNDAIFILDREIIVDANSEASRMFGRPREELLGSTPVRFSPEEQLPGLTSEVRVMEVMNGALSGEQMKFEWKHQRPDGEIFLVEVELHRLEPNDSRILVANMRDVTQLRDAVRELERTLARQAAIFDSSTAGIFLVDEKRRVTLSNRRTAELMGCDLEDILGRDTSQFFLSREEFEAFGERTYAQLEEGKSARLELKLKRMDGEVREFSFSGRTLGFQDLSQGTVWTMEDVTEQKALRREKQWLATALEEAAESIVVTDREGVIQAVNPGFEKTTGFTREEAVGQTPSILRSGFHDEAFFEKLWATIRGGEVWSGRLVNRCKDGRLVHEDATISPIHDELGTIAGFVSVQRDVTENLRIQQLLVQSEKMLSVGGLAAGMAHEINNPLGGILQDVQNIQRRLLEDLPANQKAAEAAGLDLELMRAYLEDRKLPGLLAGVRDAGERAAAIVANMLSFSRPATGPTERMDIHLMLDRAIHLASIQYDLKKRFDFRDIEIRRHYSRGLPAVLCSPQEIEQVFLNLLINSAQALAQRTDRIDALITLLTRREPDHLVIEVEDNGIGIEPEDLSRVFEPFFTTKEVGVGTGLGLSVSYFIITQNHRGTMEATSTPGEFTRFTIRLPFEEIV